MQSILRPSILQNKEPYIFLKDVDFENLRALVDYMYKGEANVPQHMLQSFIQTAESLQIRGLAEGATRHFQQQQQEQQQQQQSPSLPAGITTTPSGGGLPFSTSTPFKNGIPHGIPNPGAMPGSAANATSGGGILAARLSKLNEAAANLGFPGFPGSLFDFSSSAEFQQAMQMQAAAAAAASGGAPPRQPPHPIPHPIPKRMRSDSMRSHNSKKAKASPKASPGLGSGGGIVNNNSVGGVGPIIAGTSSLSVSAVTPGAAAGSSSSAAPLSQIFNNNHHFDDEGALKIDEDAPGGARETPEDEGKENNNRRTPSSSPAKNKAASASASASATGSEEDDVVEVDPPSTREGGGANGGEISDDEEEEEEEPSLEGPHVPDLSKAASEHSMVSLVYHGVSLSIILWLLRWTY